MTGYRSAGAQGAGDQRIPGILGDGATTVEPVIVTARRRPTRNVQAEPSKQPWYLQHPGLAESLIPGWGSGREAVADFAEGDIPGGVLNTALAVSDVVLPGSLIPKLMTKGVTKSGLSFTYKAMRRRMLKEGLVEKGQHLHHWAIPQNGWGKMVPARIKNDPLNLLPMPSPVVHGRIHGRYTVNGEKLKRYNAIERYMRATPTWWKAANASMIGHPAAALQDDDR